MDGWLNSSPIIASSSVLSTLICMKTSHAHTQLDEALGDVSYEGLDYSMRQEQEGVVRVAERVAAAMAR
jgi:hypothetical protein